MNTPTVTAAEIRAEHEEAQPEHRGDRREPRLWAVTVPKANGALVLFSRYAHQPEAETLAAALRARVERGAL